MRYSSLDSTLEQRHYDLALEQDENNEGWDQDQDRTGAQQGDIVRVMALESSQSAGHRSLRRVLDKHQAQEKLVPRPYGGEDSKRGDRRACQRDMNPPKQVPGGRPIDAGCFREFTWHVDEVSAHPEDSKGHVQCDQRKRNRDPGVVDTYRPLQKVDRNDNSLERECEPEHKQ